MTAKRAPAALPADLALRVPRADATRLLHDEIARGKALLRRSPPDLGAPTEAAQNLRRDLRAWGRDGVSALDACFGPAAADALRALPLRFTTLAAARDAVRARLVLLEAARDRAGRLRVAPEKRAGGPSAGVPRPAGRSSRAAARHTDERPYDFCLSFAGEDRAVAQRLYRLLKNRGLRVFYDNAERASLWGRNLYDHLADLYEHRAHFCVMLVSQHYVRKLWTNHEREFAQARSFRQPDYILPLRLDDAEVPGLALTRGVLDARELPLPTIADEAARLLSERRPGRTVAASATRPAGGRAKAAQKASPAPPRPRAPRDLVLLGEHVYEAAKYRDTKDAIVVHLRPRGGEEAARLRALRDRHGEAGWGQRLAFARGLDGADVAVQDVEHEVEGGLDVSVITLRPERPVGSIPYIGQDDQALAARSARFVLFGEEPDMHEGWSLPHFGRQQDARLRGGLVRTLWRDWPGTKATFSAAVKLHLVYQLKALGVVEHVTSLAVGPWKGNRLPVRLRGHRASPSGNGRTELDVQGEWTLPIRPRSA